MDLSDLDPQLIFGMGSDIF